MGDIPACIYTSYVHRHISIKHTNFRFEKKRRYYVYVFISTVCVALGPRDRRSARLYLSYERVSLGSKRGKKTFIALHRTYIRWGKKPLTRHPLVRNIGQSGKSFGLWFFPPRKVERKKMKHYFRNGRLVRRLHSRVLCSMIHKRGRARYYYSRAL